jgi:general secretion pathway protein K
VDKGDFPLGVPLVFSNPNASQVDVVSNERGAILIVVLWVMLAISLLALSFSATIRVEVDAARNVVEQKQSYYMARAGIEYSIYEILETQSAFYMAQQQQQLGPEAIPDVLRGGISLNLTGGGADVEIIDESGKINVNQAPPHLIFNLLVMIGVPGDRADIITDSIADWIDGDELYRAFGAESDYYMSLDPPYQAKNGFMDVPEELLLVNGVTPEIYYGRKTVSDSGEPIELYGLQNYVTTFSNATGININSAPVPVLASIPGLNYDVAMMIDQIRKEQPLTDPAQIAERIPGISGESLGMLAVLRTNIYTLNSLGRLDNSKVVSRIRAVVRADGIGPKGYTVIYWNESNTEL